MIPQTFVDLPALPLTPAGKVDRKALPQPRSSAAPKPQRQPESPAERLVAEVWSNALKVGSFSATDNFFDVGGHSLLSMQVTAELERRTGHRFSPRDLLRSSLEQLAAALPRAEARAAVSPAPPAASTKPAPRPAAPAPAERDGGSLLTRLKGKLFGR
jgi:hypothetical protein